MSELALHIEESEAPTALHEALADAAAAAAVAAPFAAPPAARSAAAPRPAAETYELPPPMPASVDILPGNG